MKRSLYPICVLILLIGCVSTATKPNITALYRIPELEGQLPPPGDNSQRVLQEPLPIEAQILFKRLYALDPVLAVEVGRLPEFQDKVGNRQVLALTRFTDLLANATNEEKANLTELMDEGIPEVRKYCSTLQAIFWLLEKDDYRENPLGHSLERLLWNAWYVNNDDQVKRWGDMKVAMERLNSPKLINFYEQKYFSYKSSYPFHCNGNNRRLYKTKKGCCGCYTRFSFDCLRMAGYEARPIQVVSPTGRSYHLVCEYKDKDGKIYIMDNSCRSCTGGKGILEKEIYVQRLPQIAVGWH